MCGRHSVNSFQMRESLGWAQEGHEARITVPNVTWITFTGEEGAAHTRAPRLNQDVRGLVSFASPVKTLEPTNTTYSSMYSHEPGPLSRARLRSLEIPQPPHMANTTSQAFSTITFCPSPLTAWNKQNSSSLPNAPSPSHLPKDCWAPTNMKS